MVEIPTRSLRQKNWPWLLRFGADACSFARVRFLCVFPRCFVGCRLHGDCMAQMHASLGNTSAWGYMHVDPDSGRRRSGKMGSFASHLFVSIDLTFFSYRSGAGSVKACRTHILKSSRGRRSMSRRCRLASRRHMAKGRMLCSSRSRLTTQMILWYGHRNAIAICADNA